MWAVLVAGEDDAAVHGVIDATAELAAIQSRGAGGATLAAATKQRRAAVEALVDRAVKALARFDPSADSKRAEVRQLVDQLSRHPEVAETWIDATLRDMPEDAFGFGMFTEALAPAERPASPAKKPVTKSKRAAASEPSTKEPPAHDSRADVHRRAAERAELAQQVRQTRRQLAAARRDLATFERRVASAREAFTEAEARLRAVEEQRDEAQRRNDDVAAELARLTDD